MSSARASSRGRVPSPHRAASPPLSWLSPAPKISTPSGYTPSPPPRSPSKKSPSPHERTPSPRKSLSRSSSRQSLPPKLPCRSPSRYTSRHSAESSSHHSFGAASRHAARSPRRRCHSSGRHSQSLYEGERGLPILCHSSRRSPGGSGHNNEQQRQNQDAGWPTAFSGCYVRTTPRSPSPSISPRSSYPSLPSHSESQSQHDNQNHSNNCSARIGDATQSAYTTQPTVPAASYITGSLSRDRSREQRREMQREWARERERERAHERQLNNSHWHNLSNPASYGSSGYGDVRNRRRREYGYGPGVMGDLSAGPHGLNRVGRIGYYDDEGRWIEDECMDVDMLLGPQRRGRSRDSFKGHRRRYAGDDEHVYENSSTRRSRRRDGDGGALGLATIATGLIGLGAEVADGHAAALASNNGHTGTLREYRRPRQRRPNRSSVQPLVELVTNRPDNPNQTYIERSPSRVRSRSGDHTRSCQRRNTIEGSPSREEFFTAYDGPKRPSRTRTKDWPHLPPTLPMKPPSHASTPQTGESGIGEGNMNGSVETSGERERDAVVDPASLPTVMTSKAGVSRKISTKKGSGRQGSPKDTSRPERSANASTEYPPRDLPMKKDYLGGVNTMYYDELYQPANDDETATRATPTVGYLQTAGTVGMAGPTGEVERLRLEKTGTMMARLRARLCGGINVPAA